MYVNELARRASEQPHVVRYYARVGLLRPARHPGNGYKVFTEGDIGRLRFIQNMKQLGYTLAEVAIVLGDADRGSLPCPQTLGVIERRIRASKRSLRQLKRSHAQMENAVRQWREAANGVPNGDSVRCLIEMAEAELGRDCGIDSV